MKKLVKALLLSSVIGLAVAPVTSFADETTTQAISATKITTLVKAKFTGSRYKGSDISVTTVKHTVSLTGTVVNNKQKERAEADAKSVDGVTDVINKLEVN